MPRRTIIDAHGLAGLSAREIARRIGYSPGTIYNMFTNLDDVVLHVEARVLDALDKRLTEIPSDGGDGPRRVVQIAHVTSRSRKKSHGSGTYCLSTTCRQEPTFRPGTSRSSRR